MQLESRSGGRVVGSGRGRGRGRGRGGWLCRRRGGVSVCVRRAWPTGRQSQGGVSLRGVDGDGAGALRGVSDRLVNCRTVVTD